MVHVGSGSQSQHFITVYHGRAVIISYKCSACPSPSIKIIENINLAVCSIIQYLSSTVLVLNPCLICPVLLAKSWKADSLFRACAL